MYRTATAANRAENKGMGKVYGGSGTLHCLPGFAPNASTPWDPPSKCVPIPLKLINPASAYSAVAVPSWQKTFSPFGLFGLGCGCKGVVGCNCGMGQATSIAQVFGDATTLLADVFENSDGSLNWTAIAFAGGAAALIFMNWGHTTRRGKR
jgi:hypothetical protein